jgi:hypothetical protein
MTIFNHGFDVAFSIDTTEQDWRKVSNRELLDALELRVLELRARFSENTNLDMPAGDCFGFMDTYEVD